MLLDFAASYLDILVTWRVSDNVRYISLRSKNINIFLFDEKWFLPFISLSISKYTLSEKLKLFNRIRILINLLYSFLIEFNYFAVFKY